MIEIYNISTSMGRLGCDSQLPFLNKKQLKEINSIGWSGKTLNGKFDNYEDYLNSLGRGEFQVRCTHFDGAEFTEAYAITRVT